MKKQAEVKTKCNVNPPAISLFRAVGRSENLSGLIVIQGLWNWKGRFCFALIFVIFGGTFDSSAPPVPKALFQTRASELTGEASWNFLRHSKVMQCLKRGWAIQILEEFWAILFLYYHLTDWICDLAGSNESMKVQNCLTIVNCSGNKSPLT